MWSLYIFQISWYLIGKSTNLSFVGSEESTLCLNNGIISNLTADPLGVAYGDCVSYSGGMPGDINGDSIVNIQDIVQLISIILGSIDPTDAQGAAADINSDSVINIQDIVLVISIILD